jgi:phospholipid transport system substrate-binding protein
MQAFFKHALAFSASFFLWGTAFAQTPPDALILSVSQGVLDEVKADRTLQTGDIERLNQLVDKRVMPHVNFARMTALAVGRNWRSATPEQQQQIMKEFRQLLLLTYSGAVREVSDTSVKVLPLRAKPEETVVIVRTQVVRPGKEPIQLDYRMEKSADGWKIFDLNVLGLWLVEHYRTQFAQVVTTSGIDGLIKSIRDKNQSLSQTVAAKRASSN